MNEIELYFEESRLKIQNASRRKEELRAYWISKRSIYPTLFKMARDYLGIPATSVPCEELFSSAVDLITPKRCSLADTTIQKVMPLKYWLKKKMVQNESVERLRNDDDD